MIEGDHGSAYFHPDSDAARDAIRCQVELQRAAGGNAMIGRQLYPLLIGGGLPATSRFAADGVRRFEQAGSRGGLHEARRSPR